MSTRMNQDLDEGQSGDERKLELAEIRSVIRKLVQWPNGDPCWSKADQLGKSLVPTMAAATIINFAWGKTMRPSSWTIKSLSGVAGYRMVFVPDGAPLPKGAFAI